MVQYRSAPRPFRTKTFHRTRPHGSSTLSFEVRGTGRRRAVLFLSWRPLAGVSAPGFSASIYVQVCFIANISTENLNEGTTHNILSEVSNCPIRGKRFYMIILVVWQSALVVLSDVVDLDNPLIPAIFPAVIFFPQQARTWKKRVWGYPAGYSCTPIDLFPGILNREFSIRLLKIIELIPNAKHLRHPRLNSSGTTLLL